MVAFPKSQLKRIASRAGVNRISPTSIDDALSMISIWMNKVIKDACIICEYDKTKTIGASHIIQALKLNDAKVYGN